MSPDPRRSMADEQETVGDVSSAVTPSAVGELTLVASSDALIAVLWNYENAGRIRFPSDPVPTDAADHPVLARAVVQLAEYFDGTRTGFELPLAPIGTPFQQSVWHVLRTIPYGETISYGAQAASLGRRSAARAVGAANGRNPLSIVVPCHRVVGAAGHLTGFAGGLDKKAWLLDHERRVLLETR